MHKFISNLLVICVILITSFATVEAPFAQAQTANPEMVNIPGTHQDELGCPSEWMPDCPNTVLTYDAEDDIWQGTFEIQPNNDNDKKGPRYKAALNGGWAENYGVNALPGGADIPLIVPAATQVKFYYDHKTHWITDNFNKKIIVATGDFQSQLGCSKDNDAGCLRSWLEDPEGDGLYSFVTKALKAGTYSVYNNGPDQIPGLIVMDLKDTNNLDPMYEEIVILFNARLEGVAFSSPDFVGKDFVLHTVQQASEDALARSSSYDPSKGSFTLPGRTTAVFNIAQQQAPEPTASAAESPTTSNRTPLLAGMIAALLAVAGVIFLIRSRRISNP